MTHYEILGVSSDADYVEIKYHYRRLVKQYHPDLNPSPEAKELIVRITTAYEILSDPNKRNAYDWQLLGVPVHKPVEPEVDEREAYRREYVRKKRQQEQERWYLLFKMKVKFYKVQRYFAFLFLLMVMVYTVDYFYTPATGPYQLSKITINNLGYASGRVGVMNFTTHSDFYYETVKSQRETAFVHVSGVFDLPVGISVDRKSYYQFHNTLHTFKNFFSYLLLILSLVLIYNRRYSDWALTLGIFQFFVAFFMIVMAQV